MYMKCDEARPACGRCVRAKTQCPGYQKAIKWSRKYELDLGGSSTQGDDLTSSPPKSSLPPQQQGPTASQHGNDPGDLIDNSITNPNDLTSGFNLDIPDWLIDLASFDVPTEDLCSHDASEQLSTIDIQQQNPRPSSWQRTSLDPNLQETIASMAMIGEFPLIPFQHSESGLLLQQMRQDDAESADMEAMSVIAGLTDTTTLLADFYFQETARIFSVYDGEMNPFRSLVGRLWGHSRVIYCAMQSMAATGLESLYPCFGPIGTDLRQEAVAILMAKEDCDETSLLALLMIGASTSWHDPTNSGVSFFNSFQNRMRRAIASEHFSANSNNYRFFQESSVYWQMLLSYVVDDFRMGSPQSAARPVWGPIQASSSNTQPPHPWTGVGHEVQQTVCDIGHLVRSQRQQARSRLISTEDQMERFQNNISKGLELENRLLQMTVPTESQIINPADPKTTIQHLLKLAQIYRLVGLLQIYRVFPDVLLQRLQSPLSEIGDYLRPFFESASRRATPGSHGGLNSPNKPARRDLGCWLTLFTLSILDLFKEVPAESGTCAFQPFLLVACGSELRVPSHSNAAATRPPYTCRQDGDLELIPEMSLKAVEVLRARSMVLGRLETLLRLLPPKPHRQCIFVVKETWRKMDAMAAISPRAGFSSSGMGFDDSLFWMDVMIENGWETMMG
ncbi:Fc.00g034530.m01.CDS01 [Cosmosporella sp. VM-42]